MLGWLRRRAERQRAMREAVQRLVLDSSLDLTNGARQDWRAGWECGFYEKLTPTDAIERFATRYFAYVIPASPLLAALAPRTLWLAILWGIQQSGTLTSQEIDAALAVLQPRYKNFTLAPPAYAQRS